MKPFMGFIIVAANGEPETTTVSSNEIDAWINVFGNDARRVLQARQAGHRAVKVWVSEPSSSKQLTID